MTESVVRKAKREIIAAWLQDAYGEAGSDFFDYTLAAGDLLKWLAANGIELSFNRHYKDAYYRAVRLGDRQPGDGIRP